MKKIHQFDPSKSSCARIQVYGTPARGCQPEHEFPRSSKVVILKTAASGEGSAVIIGNNSCTPVSGKYILSKESFGTER